MLPTRCPHCKAELPSVGRFCGACGRRIEGWRGIIAAPPDLLEAQADGRAAPSQATPRELPSSEDMTRPVRPSKNLAAARAAAEEESRRPTGEMPGVGHELRAKAPDHRVHTSPLGNVLPLAFMDSLGASAPESDSDPAPVPSATSVRSGPRAEPSGRRISPTDLTPTRRGDAGARAGREPSRDSGEPPLASARSDRRPAPIGREPGARSERNDDARARRRDPDTPEPVRFDATHHIARPRRVQQRFMRVLRALIWGLLWLSLGGAVAYAVAHFFHRPPSTGTAPVAKSAAPPASPATARPTKPRPSAAKLAPLGRDLVVSIPSPAPPPVPPGPAGSSPNPVLAPRPLGAPSAASAPQPLRAPAPTEPELAQLTPQQRAAVEQTMANIEFVAGTYRAQVRACYERAARSRGSLPGGRVEVAITLTDAGLAESVLTIENTLDEVPLLAACIEQRMAEWRFPRPSGPLRTFRFPFVFAPTAGGGSGGSADEARARP